MGTRYTTRVQGSKHRCFCSRSQSHVQAGQLYGRVCFFQVVDGVPKSVGGLPRIVHIACSLPCGLTDLQFQRFAENELGVDPGFRHAEPVEREHARCSYRL
jgi:hypothetical protein